MFEQTRIYKKRVESIAEIAENVYLLSFARDFEFTAGQVVAIDTIPDGEPRLYSIASGEKENWIDILFDEKADGKLTPLLSTLRAGDAIYVSKPFGAFQCKDKQAWWIASGTGIAPFASMLRSGQAKGKKLIHGARFDTHFYFSELIEKEMGEDYMRCCSQQPDTQYYPGRLTRWLEEQPSLPKEIGYYLCGSAEMVVEVRDLLIKKGVPFQQIISETYF